MACPNASGGSSAKSRDFLAHRLSIEVSTAWQQNGRPNTDTSIYFSNAWFVAAAAGRGTSALPPVSLQSWRTWATGLAFRLSVPHG